ncbi:maleylpyruvate isomerase family mycothiol-dependent enzyme [Kibdelosporangium aridum]|uniref:maleylpyruvate isomerase family mycothiol-dependent enzyme n=1 Tax=Kibdelosporangium aridum TaxID=2030 RepID=UPI000F793B32|nr:maleylpyruvate isomerase family mycothiol-dependent enzyme [Kibdelosporangium aridum]
MRDHAAVSSLLAAWTMHACDRHESDAVEDHLKSCETCRAEVRAFAQAAQSLAGKGTPPPKRVREKMVTAVGTLDIPSYAKAYAASVAALDALLKEIDAHQWTGVVAHEPWSVLDLVVHLTATDNLVADHLGLLVHPAVQPGEDPDSRTDVLLAMPRSQDTAWQDWRRQAEAICYALTNKTLPPDLMLSRAYETWIHARDIALVTHKDLPPPPPDHLHTIADFAARLLPHAAAYRRVARPGNAVRLVLAGPGGGTWTLPLGGPDLGVTVEMTMDVIQFCLLMADRREPRAVDVMIRGDVELGYDLLDAAPALAPR